MFSIICNCEYPDSEKDKYAITTPVNVGLFSGRDLQSRRKQVLSNGLMSTRVKPTQDTLNEIIQICNKIGITRISNITFMDRLGVPNFSAVLPGTEDIIWVYSGKGATI